MSAPIAVTAVTCEHCPHLIVLRPAPSGVLTWVHCGTWSPRCYGQATTATAPLPTAPAA